MQRQQVKRWIAGSATTLLLGTAIAQQPSGDYPIQPVAFTQVHLTDQFWRPRLETNATVTIPYILQKCREEGRIDNFLMAAGKKKAASSQIFLSMIPTYTNCWKAHPTACRKSTMPRSTGRWIR